MTESPENAAGPAAPYRRTFPVSWEELHRHSKALAWRLLDMGPWTGIPDKFVQGNDKARNQCQNG